MKNSMKYISAAALMFVMAACQSEEDFTSAYESDPDAVKINATIAGMATQSRVNTIGNGDTWESGDQFKVINTTSGAISGKEEAVYAYTTVWALSGTGYMVWVDGANTFQAYYPYAEGTSNSFTSFVLPADQSSATTSNASYIGKADYMTATATATKTADNKSVDLEFKHQLTKVTVKITGYNNQYTNPASLSVSEPVFTVPTTETAITDKTISVSGSATTIKGLMSPSSTDGLHSFTAVLRPGKYTGTDTFITINVGGATLTTKVGSNSTLTAGLESGKAYTFNITVGKDAITIGSVTVNDWGASDWNGVGNGGTADAKTVG